MSEAEIETITCYNVDLTKPGDQIRHGLMYRSLDVAQRRPRNSGSSVSIVEVFAEIAAELPE